MAQHDSEIDVRQDGVSLRLSERIQNANALESVRNKDGSTTIYLNVHRRERFSTLPRSERQPWLIRVLGGRSASVENRDRLSRAANVPRIPRRTTDLT